MPIPLRPTTTSSRGKDASDQSAFAAQCSPLGLDNKMTAAACPAQVVNEMNFKQLHNKKVEIKTRLLFSGRRTRGING